MAEKLSKDELNYDGDVQEETTEKFDLGEYFATYLASMAQAKSAASAQINAAYDNMVQSTNAQKDGIKKQADETFRGIYSNAKVSAANQNEQLATMGLSRGGAKDPSSGYGETSRIRLDNAMHNDLNAAAMNRDSNLAAVDTKVSELNAQRANQLSELEREYGSQYLSALQQTAQMEFDYYQWQQEMDYKQQLAAQDQANWQAQFDYQKSQDAQNQVNWQNQFDYQKTQDAQDQVNWQSQFEYQKTQDAQDQVNWQSQFDYQKAQDAQDQANWQAEFNYQKQQDAQDQQNWLLKYLQDGSKEQDTEEEAKDGTKEVKISQTELDAAAAEEKFQQYLRFANSTASFQNDEAYASYFDQLYRQKSITYDQYVRALRAKGYSDSIIKVRVGLL